MPLKILIIEDDQDYIDILSRRLSAKGHSIRSALNGKLGLSEIEKELPDIVLVDIDLPIMNGYETANAIRKDPNMGYLPVIDYSASAGFEDMESAHEEGFIDFFIKPVNFEKLLDSIELHTGSNKKQAL
jgi:CheY-like chemotaxis protein